MDEAKAKMILQGPGIVEELVLVVVVEEDEAGDHDDGDERKPARKQTRTMMMMMTSPTNLFLSSLSTIQSVQRITTSSLLSLESPQRSTIVLVAGTQDKPGQASSRMWPSRISSPSWLRVSVSRGLLHWPWRLACCRRFIAKR